jgi:hypothetical protein
VKTGCKLAESFTEGSKVVAFPLMMMMIMIFENIDPNCPGRMENLSGRNLVELFGSFMLVSVMTALKIFI